MADSPELHADLRGWQIYALAAQQDPYRTWDGIRDTSPVLDAGDGVYLVTAWELVDQVLRDHSLLAGRGVAESLDASNPPPIDAAAIWLMSLDGAPHVRARGLVRRPFAARRVAALRPLIESIFSPVIRRFLDSCRTSSGDFYQEVALAVPSEVMRSLFEIDEEPWRERVHSLFRGETGMDSTSIIGALVRFFATMDEPSGLLRALQEPGDDGSTLSSDEVIANATLLVMAGVDTTAGLIANMVHSLLRNPEVFRQLRAEPSRCNEAVEETLRFEPPALSCSRYTPHALELGDVEIPAGSHLLLCIGAANRDPKIYDSPNEFRLRGESSGLLTFGGGRHFCLGAALARLEAVVVLETLLRERVALELASPVQWRTDNPTVRLPAELQLRQASERPR